MADTEIRPSRGDARAQNLGKWLTGSGVLIASLLVVIAVLGLTVFRQVHIIDALAAGVTQQRDQFTACKNKPASAAGCTTPVAAEPSVIVKQGSSGLPGTNGLNGSVGPVGPQGPPGPAGPPGPIGKTGPPPGCALLSTACQGLAGATGPAGPPGAQGPAGADGKNGSDGATGPEGKPGPAGPAGESGSPGEAGATGTAGRGIADTDCLDDGTWRISYTDGTEQIVSGPCKVL